MTTIVLKFGGAAVASPDHFNKIADIALERKRGHGKLAIVVSAMANMTSQLVELAQRVNPNPPPREYDMLVSVGERISISLLAMALAAKGERAVSFTGSQSGIITCNEHSNARIVEVRPKRIIPLLDEGNIVIVAGFQGCSLGGEITTLGGNGSDISAVALAVALGAERVEFFKDVGGVYDSDPKLYPDASLISEIDYAKTLEIIRSGGRVLHPRCIELAQKNGMPMHIYSFDHPEVAGTKIFDPLTKIPEIPVFEFA
jgi:aspartate kinase